MIARLPDIVVEPVVRLALAEDLGRAGDVTARACVPEDARFTGVLAARREGTIAGMDAARIAFGMMDPAGSFEALASDGQRVAPGAVLARIDGAARVVLAAERTALNLLGRLSGVATLTAAYVRAVEGTGARIADTRKTTPGLRALEKHAVLCGGGLNHRFGLDDAILIKDNHIAAAGGVAPAIERARARAPHTSRIEVEVGSLSQLEEALRAEADIVMLDNFSTSLVKEALAIVRLRKPPPLVEVSGGITFERIAELSALGVDVISVGALTHSAPSADIALDIVL